MSAKQEEGWVKLPDAVIEFSDLTAHELLVYIVLLKHRNHKTGKCFPGLQAIADQARVSRKTASRTIKSLEEKNIIKVDRVKAAGSKTNESNTYTVGLLPSDPLQYVTQNAKGQRVPKRSLSRDSESLPCDSSAPSRDSESIGRDSESLGVGTPSLTNQMKINQINEPALTPTFEESGRMNVSFEISDDLPATERQVQYLKDLIIQVGYEDGIQMIPSEEHLDRWRKLTKPQADDLINKYVNQLGRPYDRYYPEPGDPEYEALSEAGKAFADTGGMPDSVWDYSSAARFMKENIA